MELLLRQYITPDFTGEKVVLSIHDQYFPEFINFLEALPDLKTNDELFVTLLKVIGLRLTEFGRDLGEEVMEKQIRLLSVTCTNEKFLETVKTKITDWSFKKSKKKDLETVLLLMYSFCDVILKEIPVFGREFLFNLVSTIAGIIWSSQHVITVDECFLGGFRSLENKIQKMCADARVEKERKMVKGFLVEYEKTLHKEKPPEDFRTIKIVPNLGELVSEEDPFVRPNKTIGEYDSGDHYLDVQFRLLREDFVRPMRKSVVEFIKGSASGIGRPTNTKPKDNSIRIYKNVSFDRIEMSKENGRDFLFGLPPELTRSVNWDKSKRLLPGCLVMLTPDGCQTAVFGITLSPPFDPSRNQNGDSRRNELSHGVLRLLIEDVKAGERVCYNKGQRYTLFECEAYFEAYKHNLKILQKIEFLDIRSRNCSRMAKYIISASDAVVLPSYFSEIDVDGWEYSDWGEDDKKSKLNLHFNSGFVLQVDCHTPNSWDSLKIQQGMGLNVDQFEALRMALTKELSLIQGPPGTGKTFVGLQIVKTLYLNKQRKKADAEAMVFGVKDKCGGTRGTVPGNAPFLVVCYTNHALDQFLELLLDRIPRLEIVRVGGQCKSEKLEQFTLARKRRNLIAKIGEPPTYRKYKIEESQALRWVRKIEDRMHRLNIEKEEIKNPNGIFCFQNMEVYEKLQHAVPKKVLDDLRFEKWLKIDWCYFDDSTEPFDLERLMSLGFVMNLEWVKNELPKIIELWKGSCVKKEESDEVNDVEDYDMDELLEKRVFDNEFEEEEKGHDVGMHKDQVYLDDCWIRRCLARADQCGNRGPSGELEKSQYKNKSEFLAAVLALYEGGHFKLPFLDYRFQSKDVNPEDVRYRWAIYFKVLRAAWECALELHMQLNVELVNARRALDKARARCFSAKAEYLMAMESMNAKILKDCDIIGMTTTGAAKNHSLLEKAGARIVIVEEAAEILEAHIITALTSHCKQLILIGDHLQLKPSTTVYELGRDFRMNVSLFERLIMNGVPYVQLKTQHRMRPEISNLIVGPIYEELLNHPDVTVFPSVKGVVKSMFFIDHKVFEDKDSDLMSKSNKHEALFIAALCNYLLKQGYEKSRITILTMYAGQMFLLKKIIGRDLNCRGVRITCVDSYQGEENDIILLSLVRSNAESNVGFVGIDNRVCVALSRARHGLYVIGNMQCLTNNKYNRTWRAINRKLKHVYSIGQGLELICEKHMKSTTVKVAEDFDKLCTVACGELLRCGHRCPMTCHSDKEIHDRMHDKCKEPCLKKIEGCGHDCKKLCYEKCEGGCTIQVLKELKCGHCQFVACSEDIRRVKCKEVTKRYLGCGHNSVVRCGEGMGGELVCEVEVEVKFRDCGHKEKVLCKNSKSAKCSNRCSSKLRCGHPCLRMCHWNNDPAHLLYRCTQNCNRKLRCNHPCAVKHMCHQSCPPCKATSEKELPCGHRQLVKCGANVNDAKCTVKIRRCRKRCSSGHLCDSNHACSDKCPPCREKVTKKFPSCGHEMKLKCHVVRDSRNQCTEKVFKELPCGHKTYAPCHVPSDLVHCYTMVNGNCVYCGFMGPVKCGYKLQRQSCKPCMKKGLNDIPSDPRKRKPDDNDKDRGYSKMSRGDNKPRVITLD